MSNDSQVDSAKHKTALTPRPTMPAPIPGCCGEWEPIAVEIVTDADEGTYDMETPPISRMGTSMSQMMD